MVNEDITCSKCKNSGFNKREFCQCIHGQKARRLEEAGHQSLLARVICQKLIDKKIISRTSWLHGESQITRAVEEIICEMGLKDAAYDKQEKGRTN